MQVTGWHTVGGVNVWKGYSVFFFFCSRFFFPLWGLRTELEEVRRTCRAHPLATASSAFSVVLSSFPKNLLILSLTAGILEAPPTISTACISSFFNSKEETQRCFLFDINKINSTAVWPVSFEEGRNMGFKVNWLAFSSRLWSGGSTLAKISAHISSNWPLVQKAKTEEHEFILINNFKIELQTHSENSKILINERKNLKSLVQTYSVSQRRQCHSWSTQCWAAGLKSWHSSAFSAFHTPGRGEPGLSAWTWHPACTSWQIPHKSVSPVPRQNPSHPARGRTLLRGPERNREEANGWYKQDATDLIIRQ